MTTPKQHIFANYDGDDSAPQDTVYEWYDDPPAADQPPEDTYTVEDDQPPDDPYAVDDTSNPDPRTVNGEIFTYDAASGKWVGSDSGKELSEIELNQLEARDIGDQTQAETDRLDRQNKGGSGLGNISPNSDTPDTKGWWDQLDDKTKTKLKGIGGGVGILLIDKLLNDGNLFESKRTPTGYRGAIDMGMRAQRKTLAGTNDPNRMPGSGGISYLTPVALSNADPNTQKAAADYLDATKRQGDAANAAATANVPKFAAGGPADTNNPRYLRGDTDGMADQVPAVLEGNQPARLAHGEFVIPADVVSHLGNGNSEAGSRKLYEMMNQVRMARTGSPEQGKEIDPDKFISTASGGIANLASPAAPQAPQALRFGEGGSTTPEDSPLNTYFGPYINTMMSQANALAEAPYQSYQGPLTAGTAPLQDQAYLGASSLNMPQNMGTTGFQPTSFTQAGVSQQYMNPYIQNALNPTIAEMRRQSDITQMQNNAKMVGAGAYGGSRQALMNTETQRNLLDKIGQTVGQGYSTAFDKAQGQFNTEQQQRQQAQNDINRYGIDVLNLRNKMGAEQRDIMQQGIAADKAAFEEERANPYKMLQFKQAMLSGMPVTNTTAGQYSPSLIQQLAGAGLGGLTLAQILSGSGG